MTCFPTLLHGHPIPKQKQTNSHMHWRHSNSPKTNKFKQLLLLQLTQHAPIEQFQSITLYAYKNSGVPIIVPLQKLSSSVFIFSIIPRILQTL